jgi:hypothetical protein
MSNDAGTPKTEAVHNAFATRQADYARARIRQFTGKCYPKLETEFAKLSGEALMELSRLIQDAECLVSRAKRQAMHEPWRR